MRLLSACVKASIAAASFGVEAKAEARFLERKNELDQVVCSLLRLENSFLYESYT